MSTPFIEMQRGTFLAEGPYAEVSREPTDMSTPFIEMQRGTFLAEGPYAEVSRNPQVIEAYMGTTQTELAGAH